MPKFTLEAEEKVECVYLSKQKHLALLVYGVSLQGLAFYSRDAELDQDGEHCKQYYGEGIGCWFGPLKLNLSSVVLGSDKESVAVSLCSQGD